MMTTLMLVTQTYLSLTVSIMVGLLELAHVFLLLADK